MKMRLLFCLLLIPFCAAAAEKTVKVHALNDDVAKHGVGPEIGTITLRDTDKGLALEMKLKGLTPGEHGIHIHEKNSCNGAEKDGKWTKGEAAGVHYDPMHTGKHLGPEGKGHRGDLPFLTAQANGDVNETIYASHLKLSEVESRSIVIHEKGDNYSDQPPMGGSGERIACGIIQ